MILYSILLENQNIYDQFWFVILTVIFINSKNNTLLQHYFSSVLCHIGDISYILYLIHYPLIRHFRFNFFLELILSSEIFFNLFDKPIISNTKNSYITIIYNISFFYFMVLEIYNYIYNIRSNLKRGLVNVLGMKNITYCCDNLNNKLIRYILIYGDSHAFQLIPIIFKITNGKFTIHFKFHYTKDIFSRYYSLTYNYSVIISKNILYLPFISIFITNISYYYFNYSLYFK